MVGHQVGGSEGPLWGTRVTQGTGDESCSSGLAGAGCATWGSHLAVLSPFSYPEKIVIGRNLLSF